jgi:transcriptional regulator with XRE-family HTH domain
MTLRALREAQGLTQGQVQKASGISQPEISKLECAASLDDRMVATVRRYLGALGDDLDLVAVSKYGHRVGIAGTTSSSGDAVDHRDDLMLDLRTLGRRFADEARATPDRKWAGCATRVANLLDAIEHAARHSAPLLESFERFVYEQVKQPARVVGEEKRFIVKGIGARGVADTQRTRSAGGRDQVELLYKELDDVAFAMCERGVALEHVVEALQAMIAKRTAGLMAPTAETVAKAVKKTSTETKRGDAAAIVRACFVALGYRRQLGTAERKSSSRAGKKDRAAKKK